VSVFRRLVSIGAVVLLVSSVSGCVVRPLGWGHHGHHGGHGDPSYRSPEPPRHHYVPRYRGIERRDWRH
jgi:hypothetical protein